MYLTYKGSLQRARLHYFKKTICRYASSPQAKVLDLGCESVDTLLVCKDLSVAAYDYSIHLANERGLHLVKEDRSNLLFPEKSFDPFFPESLLEHLKDPVEARSTLKKYLKPSGVLKLLNVVPISLGSNAVGVFRRAPVTAGNAQ